jgi:hypothetical protein
MAKILPILVIDYASGLFVTIQLSNARPYEAAWPEYRFNVSSRIPHSKGEFTYTGRDICFDPQTFRDFSEQLNAIREGKAERAEFHEVGQMIEFAIEARDGKTETSLRIQEHQPNGELTVLSACFEVDYDLFVNALQRKAADFAAEISNAQREQFVEKLVNTMHLNVPERLALSPSTVSYSEVAVVIARVLDRCGSFPENARLWQPGCVVDERTMLHKLPDGRIRLTRQRHHPIAPQKLAEKKEADFNNLESAITAYIQSEWPRGIDGIRIEPDSPGTRD